MTKADQALTRAIGQRLRAAREARGLSLSQLADLTGGLYSKPRISNYEQGLRRVTIEGAQVLCEALGNVSVAHILCVDDHCAASPEETALLAGFRALAAGDQQQVLDWVKDQSGT
ncbi:MAG: helix-turn-helix domain-containing protein [Gammaproteobacteria bacterium]|jgi:transcriptional regulator with XRE-family HTH domain|nr:helix-turn-helix domain-containing protein [Gammaproteobacteria bacterium]